MDTQILIIEEVDVDFPLYICRHKEEFMQGLTSIGLVRYFIYSLFAYEKSLLF